MRAAYAITVNGAPVTSAFAPLLISLEISDGDGDKSDTLTITLDDSYGRIVLPQPGSPITARLWWEEPPPGASSQAVEFTGVTDDPKSHGSRDGGRLLTISAKSADLQGKGKEKDSKHFDNQSFAAVAQAIGGAAGYQVSVDSALGAIQREYWAQANESFFAWGKRIARELGATFKVAYPKAVFVPRNGSASASGASLSGVTAKWGDNLISWEVTPKAARGIYNSASARWYDHKTAKWHEEKHDVSTSGGKVGVRHTFKAATQDRAKARAGSNADDAERKAGGGSVEIDGDPAAQAQAELTIAGVRPGIDGRYLIKSARHHYTRGGGWVVHCQIERPQDAAGSDAR